MPNNKTITATEVLARQNMRAKEIHDFIFPNKETPPEIKNILGKKVGEITNDELVLVTKNIVQELTESAMRAKMVDAVFDQIWQADEKRFKEITKLSAEKTQPS